MLIFGVGTTTVVTLEGLFDRVDLEYKEGATVTLSLFYSDGSEVADAQDISMVHVVGSTGEDVLYRGEVPYTASITPGRGKALVVATVDGKRRRFLEDAKFERRAP